MKTAAQAREALAKAQAVRHERAQARRRYAEGGPAAAAAELGELPAWMATWDVRDFLRAAGLGRRAALIADELGMTERWQLGELSAPWMAELREAMGDGLSFAERAVLRALPADVAGLCEATGLGYREVHGALRRLAGEGLLTREGLGPYVRAGGTA